MFHLRQGAIGGPAAPPTLLALLLLPSLAACAQPHPTFAFPPPPPPPRPPTATPIPVVLETGAVHWYKTTNGLTAFGLLSNKGTTSVQRVRVVASANDTQGATIGAGIDQLLPLIVLPPGQDVPF